MGLYNFQKISLFKIEMYSPTALAEVVRVLFFFFNRVIFFPVLGEVFNIYLGIVTSSLWILTQAIVTIRAINILNNKF